MTGEGWMDIGRGRIAVSAEREPARLPWRNLDIDTVFECTGKFTKRAEADVISKPAPDGSSFRRPPTAPT